MNVQLKALRTLVKVREREGERLEQVLSQARAQLADCEAQVSTALDELAACNADEAQAYKDLDEMMSAAFTPAGARALGFRIDDCKAAIADAQRGLAERRKAVERQGAVVVAAQAALRRNEQRIEGFKEHIERLLKEREAAAEELAEEETEEASTARFVARQRAARESASHG